MRTCINLSRPPHFTIDFFFSGGAIGEGQVFRQQWRYRQPRMLSKKQPEVRGFSRLQVPTTRSSCLAVRTSVSESCLLRLEEGHVLPWSRFLCILGRMLCWVTSRASRRFGYLKGQSQDRDREAQIWDPHGSPSRILARDKFGRVTQPGRPTRLLVQCISLAGSHSCDDS